jgi:hypothetical protein
VEAPWFNYCYLARAVTSHRATSTSSSLSLEGVRSELVSGAMISVFTQPSGSRLHPDLTIIRGMHRPIKSCLPVH